MKKGMAVALGAGVVVVAGWVGATWYAGTKIEARVAQLLADVNQHLEAEAPMVKLRLEQRDYARGVFTSQMRYALILERSDFLPPNFPVGSIEFDTHIEHGPWPMARLARGALAPVLAASHSELVKTDNIARLFELTGGVPPYRDDVVMHYNGQVEAQGQIAAMRYADAQNGLAVAFSGMDVQSQSDALFPQTRATAQGRAASLRVEFGNAHVQVSDITLDVDNTMGKFGIMNGDVAMKLGRIEFADNENTQVQLDDFVYRVDVSENDTAVSVKLVYGLGKLVFNQADLGGGEIVATLENLDAAALQALQQAYAALTRAALAKTADTTALTALLAGGEKLLAGKPVVTIAPRWQTGAHESTLSASVGLTAPPGLVQAFSSGTLPDDLILQLIERINVDLAASKAQMESLMATFAAQAGGATPEQAQAEAAQQVRMLAGMAEMLNLAKNDGDKLTGTFRYADGVARLNGIDVPLHDYLPGLSDLADTGLFGGADDDDDFDFDDDDHDHDHDHDDDDHDHD